MTSSLIKPYSSKIDIQSPKITLKAEEICRMWDLKMGRTACYSDSVKAVICLDIAATDYGEPFNKEKAQKMSGFGKKKYFGLIEIARKSMGMESILTLKQLSIQFGVYGVEDLAEKVLHRYKDRISKQCFAEGVVDMRAKHTAAAFCAACGHYKFKIDKKKLVDIARIPKSDFDKLINEFKTIVVEMIQEQKEKTKHRKLYDEDDLLDFEPDDGKAKRLRMEDDDSDDEDKKEKEFEEWKKKMLD